MKVRIEGGFNVDSPQGWYTLVEAKDWKGQRVYINYYTYDAKGRQRRWNKAGYVDSTTGEYVGPKSTEAFLKQHGVLPIRENS